MGDEKTGEGGAGPRAAEGGAVSTGDEPNANPDAGHSDQVVTVAAAAASGVGLLGFVALAGGVVLWRRFGYMQLPADDAVALVPKSRLLATGADFLVVPFLLSTIIVVAVVLAKALRDRLGRNTPPGSLALALIVGSAIAIVEMAVAVGAHDSFGGHAGRFFLLLGLATASALIIGFSFSIRPGLRTVALGAIAFLSVGTFWIAFEYEKLTAGSLRVVPMAYARHSPGMAVQVVRGFLVTETSDRIVYAAIARGGDNALHEFPRSQADDVEIGAAAPTGTATKRAAEFAYTLCRQLDASTVPTTSRTRQPCSRRYVLQLTNAAGILLPPTLACRWRMARASCAIAFPQRGRVTGQVSLVLVRSGKRLTFGPIQLAAGVARLPLYPRPGVGLWMATVVYTSASQQRKFMSEPSVRVK